MRGEDIKKVREATGMLQPEFAARLGIHPVTLSRFERDRDPINRTVELAIYELAARLNVREHLPVPKPEMLVAKRKSK